jgi:O-antigen biosynthesis protein WbqP
MYLKLRYFVEPILAFLLIVLLSPILLIISLWIMVDSKGPVLFYQRRIGQNETEFMIIKFRTMVLHTPTNIPTHQLSNPSSYITKSGRFLRKTSMDELPQLINILKGQMSFIGPRPALYNQQDLIRLRAKYRVASLKPGITGWAQVHGRDELELETKAKLDGYYVTHATFWTDLLIVLKTVVVVLRKKGVVEGGTGSIDRGFDE